MTLHALGAFVIAAVGGAVAPDPVPPAVEQALSAAVTATEARVEIAGYDARSARGCEAAVAELQRPVEGSGRVAVRVAGADARGRRCTAWLWVEVRVFARVLVASRTLREGEPLAGAVRAEERELRPGRTPQTESADVVAGRTITAGTMIEAGHVRSAAARAGDSVKVVVSVGALAIEQTGRSVPCGRGRACAILPSGRHVEGTFTDGRLYVRVP